MQYFAPWNPAIMLDAHTIVGRLEQCRALKIPPHASPSEYRESVAQNPQIDLDGIAMRAAEQWDAMTRQRPTAPNDGERLIDAMRSGLYERLYMLGGRAGSKSHEAAEALIEIASNEPKRIVAGREFMANIRDSSRALLVQKIKQHPSVADWTIHETELSHKNGSLITFIGLARNPDAARSLEGADIFFGEEAANFSADSLEILEPSIRQQGSMLLYVLNPRFKDDPVYDAAMVERRDASWVKVSEFEDNPFIFVSRLYNDIRSDFFRSKRYKHVWRGYLDTNSDLKIIQHVEGFPEVAADRTRQPTTLYGIDFGGTDPTAFIRVLYWHHTQLNRPDPEDERGLIWINAEFIAPCKSNADIVRGVKLAAPELLEGRYVLKADAADPKAIGELSNAGIPTHGARKGADSVIDGIRDFNSHEIWISPHCPITLKCAERYHWQSDRSGKPLNAPEHKWSHPWDALRYAIRDVDLQNPPSDEIDYLAIQEKFDAQPLELDGEPFKLDW